MVALGLSILFMYLILAAQFESWSNPLAILAALPVTIPFGLLSLLLFGQRMDLYAMFGLFMLVGIVKKNGILQVDKTNELRRAGMDRDAAILEANHTRLRPILMTTMMLIAAMVPIALGQGPGAGARASMAKVIIGGQMLSLLLALLVTPVTYSLLDSFTNLFPPQEVAAACAASEDQRTGARAWSTSGWRTAARSAALRTHAPREWPGAKVPDSLSWPADTVLRLRVGSRSSLPCRVYVQE